MLVAMFVCVVAYKSISDRSSINPQMHIDGWFESRGGDSDHNVMR